MLARALVNASLVQGKLGKNEAAIRTGQRGLRVDELVLRHQPGDLLFRRRMAARWMNLGLDLFDLDRGPDALTALQRSRQLYEELARELNDHPERRSVLADAAENPRRGLALAEFNIGLVLPSEENFSESRERLAGRLDGKRTGRPPVFSPRSRDPRGEDRLRTAG